MSRRFLAPKARVGDGHGYLSRPERPLPEVADEPDTLERIRSATAMCDEPEAPSREWVDAEADLAAKYSRLRLLKAAEDAREIRRTLSLEQRIADASRRAKLQRVDLSGEFYVIAKMMQRGQATAAGNRLARAEAQLDGVT